eukprot:GGOE01037113.1.p1 GENE.GGOE01037113.1~~GGOE01037113.1.p1  ORF type:complete len:747 (-),score=249.77 GGOE01037113.1:200-2362(-)
MSRIPVRGIKSLVAANRRASAAPPTAPDLEVTPSPLLDLIGDRVDKQRAGLQNKSDLMGLQGDLEQLSRLFGNEELKSQLRAALDEVQALRKQLQAQAALQKEIADVRQDFDRLSGEYQEYREAMEEQYATAVTAVEEVRSTLTATEEQHLLDLQARDGELAAAAFQLQQLQAKLHFTEDQLRRTEEALVEVRAETSSLRQQAADALASQAATAAELQKERSHQQSLSAAWEEERRDWLQRLARAQREGTEAASCADGNVQRLQFQNEEFMKQLMRCEAELAACRAEQACMASDSECKLKAAAERISQLDAEVACWREAELRWEAERQTMQLRRDAESNTSAAVQAELDRMRHAIIEQELVAAEELRQLRDQLQASTVHAQQLQRLLDATKAEGAEGLSAIQDQLGRERAAAEDRSLRFQAEAASLQAALERQQHHSEEREAEIGRLIEQLNAARQETEGVQRLKDLLNLELEDLKAQHSSLQAALREAEQDRDEARAVPHRTAALEAELSALREVGEDERRRLQEAKAETDRVRRQLEGVQLQLKGAEGDVTALTRLRAQLEGQLVVAKREAAEAKQEAERRAGALKRLSEELEELRQQQALEDRRVETQLARLRVLKETAVAVTRKLIAAEEGAESLHTCLSCLRIFTRPTTCVPCGHTFCGACLPQPVSNAPLCCPECDRVVQHHFLSEALDLLSGKYTYRRQVLGDLLRELMQTTG